MPKLGSFKLGDYNLGEKVLSYKDFTNIINLIPEGQNLGYKDFIGGVVLVRNATKDFTGYLNIYNNGTKDLENTIILYNKSIFDLSNSLLIYANQFKSFDNYVNIVYANFFDFNNNTDLVYQNTIDFQNNITLYYSFNYDVNNNVNIIYENNVDLTNSIKINYLVYKNIDNNITLIGQDKKDLNNVVNPVYYNFIELSNSIEIRKYYYDLSNTITLKTLDLQGILLYKDSQLTQLIDNDTQSFIYNFGEYFEEERVIPLYVVNGLQKSITNLMIGVNYEQPYQQYGQHMVFLSSNGLDFTSQDISLGTLYPTNSNMFYVKVSVPNGIITQTNVKVDFRIYKR